MTLTYSISEAKTQLGRIGEKVKNGDNASILKNGKPFFYIISPEEEAKYKLFLRNQKIKEWEKTLEWEEISEKDAISIAEAKKETSSEMSIDEFFHYINS